MGVSLSRFVPADPVPNLRWRAKVRKLALKDVGLQQVLRQAAMEDPLFFIGAFAWLIEPRGNPKVIPFCLWPHQVDAVLTLVKSVEEATTENPLDVIFDKSRGQGATWLFLYILVWFWLKDPMFAGGIISRSIEAVDKKNYKGSLFPKLDWALPLLPFWMRPRGFNARQDRSQTDHTWNNRENSSVLAGTACTAEAFSGDRLTVAAYDEAAKVDHEDFDEGMNSIQHVTNTRWVISTHYGDSGPFYEMVFNDTWTPVGDVKPFGGSGVYINSTGSYKVVLDWRDNPSQNRLAYRVNGNQCFPERREETAEVMAYFQRIRDNGAWNKIKRKGFVKDGRLRSPWYDRKCLAKGATPMGVAQDIDRDPRSSVGKLFNQEVLDEMEKRGYIRPAEWEGDAIVRDGVLHLVESSGGSLKLWFRPGLDDEAPKGKFVLGADISTGLTGGETGNSALEGANCATGEQILEWVGQIPEARFAHLSVALAEWLGDAFLIWESCGAVGKRYANAVVDEIGYWNVYRRQTTSVPNHKNTDVGWVNNRERDKVDLFEDFWLAMDDEEFIPHCAEMIAECRGWERDKNHKIVYHGTGHGDRAIAGGLCRKGMKEISASVLDKSSSDEDTSAKEWSMQGRLDKRIAAAKRDEEDDFAGFRRVSKGGWCDG